MPASDDVTESLAKAIRRKSIGDTLPIAASPTDKVYPVTKIATLVDAIEAEGAVGGKVLEGTHILEGELESTTVRVSQAQLIQCYRNAMGLASDPCFAYRLGLRHRASMYGAYGFALLSCRTLDEAIRFAVDYHELAIPLSAISFREENGRAYWTNGPILLPDLDPPLHRFLIDLQFGIELALHRDVLGPSFAPLELHVTYAPDPDEDEAARYRVLGCPTLFRQSENQFVFDPKWRSATPPLANDLAYKGLVAQCEELVDELARGTGIVGKVRSSLLMNLARPTSLDAIAAQLNMAPRTLRRQIEAQGTTFRKIADEVRLQIAIKYLLDARLTNAEVARSIGFSDPANFRHAFRRWTNTTPSEFRRSKRGVPRR